MKGLRYAIFAIMSVFVVLAISSVRTQAQAVNATLVGTISDSTGAVLPGAKVAITETKTGIGRTTETNQSGNYVLADLPPGQYDVAVEHSGFKKALRSAVDVVVNSTTRVDLTMQPGAVSEQVEVTAEAAILQTDRADISQKMESRQVVDLPLGTNRNFQGLLNLVPGTVRAHRDPA